MNNEEKILEILSQMQSDMTDVKTDIAGMKNEIAGMKADIADLKVDVAGLKVDVADLKVDVAGLKADVAELKTDMIEVKATLEEHRVRLDRIDERSTRTAVLLENEVNHKLNLLYEGYGSLRSDMDKLASKSRVDALEADVSLLKDAVKLTRQEISELKKAQ